MALITKPNTFSAGATIIASEHNSNFDTIYNDYNGNITNANISASAAIVDTKFAQLTTASKVSYSALVSGSNALDENKGSDIASATTTDIGAATGNFVDVTGTTTITGLGTIQAGTRRIVQFDGALILTHNGTSLILPGNANITTAAGDVATFISLGSGNWVCTQYQVDASVPGAGQLIQIVNTQFTTAAQTSGTAFDDDTIPQLSECPVIAGFSTAVTAGSSSNPLFIDVLVNLEIDSSSTVFIVALFLDSGTAAIAAVSWLNSTGTITPGQIKLSFETTAADTSAHTYKIGIGAVSGNTATVNGADNARKLGGVMHSSMRITEVKA